MSAVFDVGPLTWVKSEIDSSLERARAALKAFVAKPEGKGELKAAQTHLHQASGAVQIVGLDGVSRFFEETERLVGDLDAGKVAPASGVMQALERAIGAIGKYLAELLEGAPDQPLRLFGEFRALAEARGAQAPSEADLFYPDLSLAPPPREKPAVRLAREQSEAFLRTQRARFQRGFVKWLRDAADKAALEDMRAAVDALEEVQGSPAQRAFWWVAGAFFDALAHRDLAPEPGVKQLCSRIEQQIRRMTETSPSVAERTLREALYWVARAGGASARARAVQQAYRLQDALPKPKAEADVSQRMPAALALREAIAAAKDAWTKFASGTDSALPIFAQHARNVVTHGKQLELADVTALTAEIGRAAESLLAAAKPASEAVAMEVATALLLAENAAENYQSLAPDFSRQAKVMLERLAVVVFGAKSTGPLPTGPLVTEMTRRAQEKLAVATTLAEMQSNLQKIEQALDAYFRDPAKAGELDALAPMIHQVAGALRMLGEEEARATLERCAEKIRGFAAAAARPALEEFEEVAQILSGLGFYIDALKHGKTDFAAAMQPVRARALEQPGAAPAPAAASVEQELAREKRDTQEAFEAWQKSPADPKLKAELKERLLAIESDAALVADASLGAQAGEAIAQLDRAATPDDSQRLARTMANIAPPEAPSAEAVRLKDASAQAIDQELLGIFLEEAVDVLATIGSNLEESRRQPASIPQLTTIRRGFHTLKGSGRMVGLSRLGEAAWAVEQVMNLWLQEERSATPDLLSLIARAHATFSDWIARLKQGEAQPDADAILAAAERVKRGGPIEGAAAAAPRPAEAAAAAREEEVVVIGEARISRSLFAIFINEAQLHLETLEREFAALAAAREIREDLLRAAHTLAGICGTAQLDSMFALGSALEAALLRLRNRGEGAGEADRGLLGDAIAGLREMYAEVAAGRSPAPRTDLAQALDGISVQALAAALVAAAPAAGAAEEVPALPELEVEEIPLERRGRRLEDEIDSQLLPVFLEEAAELAPQVGERLRAWRAEPANMDHAKALQRALHTIKGSSRMAGVMSLGELTHHMETRVENAVALNLVPAQLLDDLEVSYDRMSSLLERLQKPQAAEVPAAPAAPAAAPAPGARPEARPAVVVPAETAQARAMLRVRADLLEKLVNQAGEVAIARSRIEGEMRTLKQALSDLTENVARLRHQLREIEIQAETQMQTRAKEAEEKAREFDPLEFDRFTRFQELTRLMAEGVSDVTTVQQNIVRVVDDTDSALSAQSRLTRELQQDLMRVRMVPVGTLAERLHRLVRQTSKELAKRANLDIRGANVELDRSVLERITSPFEHLLRNSITHGIEEPAARAAAGKAEIGEIRLDVRQEGNEVTLALSDDGAGLNFERIRARGTARGLIQAGEAMTDAQLAELIFMPGFTTAEKVTEVAGRGVGMDVVKNEVTGLGGRIEIASTSGQGTKFTIRLPLTTAVTQTVLVRSGARTCALSAVMVEQVQHLRHEQAEKARAAGHFDWAGRRYPLAYLPDLLGEPGAPPTEGRRYSSVILVRSGVDSIALLVDEMIGNQEVVVKNLGPQLARVPGVAGVSVLGSGEIVLLLNPVPLAQRPRLQPRPAAAVAAAAVKAPEAKAQPRVMVVDDSLTVRKITGRLLAREGYQVLTAKDGVEALEQLAEVVPDVMLVDIEMPRMDGFDLTRNVRGDARLKDVPIIMITSRTADKHKNYAAELGVNVFLGKPYQEEELLEHIAGFVRR